MAAKKAARRSPRTTAKTRRKIGKRRPVRRAKPALKRAKASKTAARKTKPLAKKASRKTARRPAAVAKVKAKRPARPNVKAVAAKTPVVKPVNRVMRPAAVPKPARRSAPPTRTRLPSPALDRARRILPEAEGLEREVADEGMFAAARSGGEELQNRLGLHTEASPALTAGDLDAKWEDAYAVGDEAPGGDNPTPDQDRVDDIGKALGIEYQDDQELLGGEEVIERDRHRWELDPASSDDWPHDKGGKS